MNKIVNLLFGGVIVLGTTSCSNIAKTSVYAPNSIDTNGKIPDLNILLHNQSDATNIIRRAQANADIRAREQRYNRFGQGGKRADRDLQSEVRSKLEVNLPIAQLAVKAEEGVVTIAGIVSTQKELNQIETLAQEIRGVERVIVKAIVPTEQP